MDLTASLAANVDAAALYRVVSDLGTYPNWLDIVGRAEPAPEAEGDLGPAWAVSLRGQIGPLRRQKRLRMVRTLAEDGRRVRFERREIDARSHSAWVLEARLVWPGNDAESAAEADLEMSLHYGGSLWVPMLDRLLRDEIERSRGRLVALAQREADAQR